MSAYDILKSDFMGTMFSPQSRRKHCPYKTCMPISCENGVVTESYTVMPAVDAHGNFGSKGIYVNDITGEYKETYTLNGDAIDYSGLTIHRCALMAKLVIELSGEICGKIGFIGNGRINLAIRNLMCPRYAIIHGAPGRYDKNKDKFSPCIVDTDFSHLNKCDAVFVCTNSYSKDLLISANELKCKFVICYDCGYTLDEGFRREYELFSDYPEQLENQYDEEFPFDMHKGYEYKSILDENFKRAEKKCVYLHGCGINDLSMAKAVCNDKATIKR